MPQTLTSADVRYAFRLADWWRSVLKIGLGINFIALVVPFAGAALGQSWVAMWMALMFVSIGIFFLGRWRNDVWHARGMQGLEHIPRADALLILDERIKSRR